MTLMRREPTECTTFYFHKRGDDLFAVSLRKVPYTAAYIAKVKGLIGHHVRDQSKSRPARQTRKCQAATEERRKLTDSAYSAGACGLGSAISPPCAVWRPACTSEDRNPGVQPGSVLEGHP